MYQLVVLVNLKYECVVYVIRSEYLDCNTCKNKYQNYSEKELEYNNSRV